MHFNVLELCHFIHPAYRDLYAGMENFKFDFVVGINVKGKICLVSGSSMHSVKRQHKITTVKHTTRTKDHSEPGGAMYKLTGAPA